MFRFIKKVSVVAMTFFICNALECASKKNQECKMRPRAVNMNSDNPFFYPESIEVNKCSSSCNNFNDPYSKLRVPKGELHSNFSLHSIFLYFALIGLEWECITLFTKKNFFLPKLLFQHHLHNVLLFSNMSIV